MVSHLPSENQIVLSKICTEHDVEQLLELSKKSKNWKDVSLHGSFYTACINNSDRKEEFVDTFIEKFKNEINFSNICANMVSSNDFETFKKLSNYIPIDDLLPDYLNQTIEISNTDFLKNLLNTYAVQSETIHNALVKACECGSLEITKYLLSNYDVDIHFNNDLAVRRAGSHNHLEIVKYLLEDKNLKENADPHAFNDDLSITAIMQGNKELIDYLYNIYGLKESETVKDYKNYKESLKK